MNEERAELRSNQEDFTIQREISYVLITYIQKLIRIRAKNFRIRESSVIYFLLSPWRDRASRNSRVRHGLGATAREGFEASRTDFLFCSSLL